MTEQLRRRDDLAIADFDKRLALLEQAAVMSDRAHDARSRATDRALEALTTEVRGSLSLIQAAISEPSATPAGRAVVADIEAIRGIVALNTSFREQAIGALRLARFALGTSVLAVVGQIISFLIIISRAAGPS